MSTSSEMTKLRKKYLFGKAEAERAKNKKVSEVVDSAICFANSAASKGLSFASLLVDKEICNEVEVRLKNLSFKVKKKEPLLEAEETDGLISFEISGWADEED